MILRGINLQGIGAGLKGVRFVSGKALHVEDCTINGFTMVGVDVEPTAGSVQISVENSVISQNTLGNILVSPTSSAVVHVVVDKSQLLNAGYGLNATGAAQVSVHDSTVSGHTGTNASANG